MSRAYLAAVEDEIIKCMRCGNCQAVCPLYRETRWEPAVARGKVRLAQAVLKGELPCTVELKKRFDLCLTCMACVANCPSGVRVDRIILAARAALAEACGLPVPARTALGVMRRPGLFEGVARTLSRVQGLFFKRRAGGMTPRFPVGLEWRRVFPPLAAVPFKSRVPEENPVKGAASRVALFTGCLANYIYTGTGEGALRALNAAGVSVVVPKGQHCCGYPALVNGAVELAREMARSHVQLFHALGCDAVITLCGTCGEAFKLYYPELLVDDPLGEAAAALSEHVYDIAQCLWSVHPLDLDRLRKVDAVITYHEPCHLGRGLGVKDEPLALICAIPGVRFAPLKDPARCCGGAGSFGLTHYNLAATVRQRKLDDIVQAGGEIVATGCSACRMHLEEGIAQQGLPQKVMHTIELLASAL
ncbi:MAG: hypothetical protein XD69_0525 [Clostridia bacterium 62_21]|nr:MAG: hypothetical protein XD69_0525 [Clostridia bacterium 62_21]